MMTCRFDEANPEKNPIRECIACGTLYEPVEELVGWRRDKLEGSALGVGATYSVLGEG